MKSKYKSYIRLNIVSLFFIAVSFISVTLAWFAYSGIAKVGTEIDVKAWNIEFSKGDEPVSNNIVISLSEIYPGMDIVDEQVRIKNTGDSDAHLKYSIASVRILDDQFTITDSTDKKAIEDQLAHDYPFHININLSKNYILSPDSENGTKSESMFDVSISWPLDSGNDVGDSTWGNDAYNFQRNEERMKQEDPNYNIRTSIKIEISVIAEQYLESNPNSSDYNYDLGDLVLYDITNNKSCDSVSETCIITHVIDVNNTLGDQTVTLLPLIYNMDNSGKFDNYDNALNTYRTRWNANIRKLTAEDIMRIISKDITDSWLIGDGISDAIIGNIQYGSRATNKINLATSLNGYFKYNAQEFSYISSNNIENNKCYWTASSYSNDLGYAFTNIDTNNAKLYGTTKNSDCSFIPVILASKNSLSKNN